MDPILYWNDVALEANRISVTNGQKEQPGPTLSSRALAIVHLAMYDAYAGVRGNPVTPELDLSAYLSGLPTPGLGATVESAVAAAAHTTLSQLYPSQKSFFDLKYTQANLPGNGLAEGPKFGRLVAMRILNQRKDDPNDRADGYAASGAPRAHRVDPDNAGQGFHAPYYGAKSVCFAVTDRHDLLAPYASDSPEYLAALQQVRAKGIAPELMATLPAGLPARTAEETVIGIYWGYDGAAELGTPPRLYNQIVRQVAISQKNTPDQNARLFALVNTAMADAGILAWEQKYVHDLWRPVLGIREHDASFGQTAIGKHSIDPNADPDWLPLGAPNTNSIGKKNGTPHFPAYPSGHATFGAAALHITRLFYGITTLSDDTTLFNDITFVSDEFNGVNLNNKGTVRPKHVRSFPGGLWQMILENGLSRVFLGVHWQFDAFAVDALGNPDVSQKIGGVRLGLDIATDIHTNGLHLSTVGPRA